MNAPAPTPDITAKAKEAAERVAQKIDALCCNAMIYEAKVGQIVYAEFAPLLRADAEEIARLRAANKTLDNTLQDLLSARVVEVSEHFVDCRLRARETLNQVRAALNPNPTTA